MDNEYLADIAHQWDSISDLEAYLADLRSDEPLLLPVTPLNEASEVVSDALAKAHEDITDAITAVDAHINQLKLQEENK